MDKIKLKLKEIQSLDIELNGYRNTNNEVLITGLLNEKLKLVVKYWLTSLNNTIQKEIQLINELRNELIRKYGVLNEKGIIVIELLKDNQPNSYYYEFQNEFNELLEEEKEIECTPLTLNDISNIEVNFNTPILFKLINNE